MNAGPVASDMDRVFAVEHRTDGVVVVRMDVPDAPVNLLKMEHVQALERLLEGLERRSGVEAVVFTSAKPDNFVVGPDVTLLQEIRTVNDGIDRSRAGQALMDRVAGLRIPVVAAIHGACLGSGLELALACRGRVASLDPTTVFGLPEIELGLLPAMGGTQRLPRLIGFEAALDLLLTGHRVRAERAHALGLVDAAVAADQLLETAAARALELGRAGEGAGTHAGPTRACAARARAQRGGQSGHPKNPVRARSARPCRTNPRQLPGLGAYRASRGGGSRTRSEAGVLGRVAGLRRARHQPPSGSPGLPARRQHRAAGRGHQARRRQRPRATQSNGSAGQQHAGRTALGAHGGARASRWSWKDGAPAGRATRATRWSAGWRQAWPAGA